MSQKADRVACAAAIRTSQPTRPPSKSLSTSSCSVTFLCLCLCPFVSPTSHNPYFFNLTMALRIPQGTQMLKDGYKVSLRHTSHLHPFDIHTITPYLSPLFSPSLSQKKRRKNTHLISSFFFFRHTTHKTMASLASWKQGLTTILQPPLLH